MSAALKPSVPSKRNRSRLPSANSASAQRQPVPLRSVNSTAVRRLPSPDAPPRWLRSLIRVQQASLIATFTLAGAVLLVYGWTVYAQQLWGKEYQKLEQLRRSERQMTTNGEILKNKIADQAGRPGTTLVPQTPDSLIFLKPAPARNPPPAASPAPQASPIAPLGY
ncbi:hypothetical protein C7B65_17190 [Phormidesmis priestleyi ULC007]|uniref:Cell division protein FtsL n=1 Tax=Phormidesmis priestleyi ULC007 TaxID=1920490 RepID=A0A2T1DBR2_9CYAN|nr:hypothetical protein [Phormidesmis priestleyi]PSB17930.1 hypothetical protein C7B65_17190 [Phormidesmis priestleyi ULC007]PZO53901.1 MAG: hypothetical protein DCF14_02925 [Phormidesmis priestleyi]